MKKILINWFASASSLLIFAIALDGNQIPLAILAFIAFAVCLLWFADIIKQIYERSRRSERREPERQEYYSIDIPLDDPAETVEEQPETFVIKDNVNAGSRPSEGYFTMLERGGRYSDIRRKA